MEEIEFEYNGIEFTLKKPKKLKKSIYGYVEFYYYEGDAFEWYDLEPTSYYYAFVELSLDEEPKVIDFRGWFWKKSQITKYLSNYKKNKYTHLSDRQIDKILK